MSSHVCPSAEAAGPVQALQGEHERARSLQMRQQSTDSCANHSLIIVFLPRKPCYSLSLAFVPRISHEEGSGLAGAPRSSAFQRGHAPWAHMIASCPGRQRRDQ